MQYRNKTRIVGFAVFNIRDCDRKNHKLIMCAEQNEYVLHLDI